MKNKFYDEIKQLEKETSITFSEKSLDIIFTSINAFFDGKTKNEILSAFSPNSVTHNVIEKALNIVDIDN
jgi:hypothetical protein